jgi:hypothetical protein
MGTTLIPAGMQDDPQYFVPPYDRSIELDPNFFCRARNVKREKYCRARAGQGTDHLGSGRCKNHGGSTPIVHGRYSEVVRGTLGEHLDRLELESDQEKLDILPEAAMLRGLTLDLSERWTQYVNGIIAYNQQEAADANAEERRPKYLSPPNILDLADLVKKTAEIVNMVHKQRSTNAISIRDFQRLMVSMATSVGEMAEKHLMRHAGQDRIDVFLKALEEEWRKIKLSSFK